MNPWELLNKPAILRTAFDEILLGFWLVVAVLVGALVWGVTMTLLERLAKRWGWK